MDAIRKRMRRLTRRPRPNPHCSQCFGWGIVWMEDHEGWLRMYDCPTCFPNE